MLDCIVEAEAVVRRVVKPVLLAMGVVAEVLKTRIAGDVLAQVVHAVEEIRQRIALVDVRLEHLAERSLANLAVVVLQKRRHLRWRLLLAVPVHGHGADHLRPLRRQLREIGVEGHIRRGEELHLVAKSLHGRLQPRPDVIEVDQALLQLRPLLLGLGCDLAAEPQLRFLALGVRGIACISEARQRGGFRHQGLQHRPVLQPGLDVGPIQRPRRELFVIGEDVAPARVLERVRRPR